MQKIIFTICIMTIFVGNSTLLFGGPPVKKIKVTVVNTCEWDIPVGLGRDVNTWWFDEKEKEKLTIKRIPANGSVVFEDIQAGIKDWTFIVSNETTNYFQSNSLDWEFLKDTLITVTYDFDEMEYNWTKEEQ